MNTLKKYTEPKAVAERRDLQSSAAATEERRYATVCPTCGLDFGGTRAFDLHRAGRQEYDYSDDRPDGRRCLAPLEMLAMGMYINKRGHWSQPQNGLFERLGYAGDTKG